ncbi:prepilin peptidase [Oscillospiraceae bacterium OttesenSCG-928-F05]|nr:prepilin peptidase [Oscillospiraceae bacterium OttesenSCG-928-F05]
MGLFIALAALLGAGLFIAAGQIWLLPVAGNNARRLILPAAGVSAALFGLFASAAGSGAFPLPCLPALLLFTLMSVVIGLYDGLTSEIPRGPLLLAAAAGLFYVVITAPDGLVDALLGALTAGGGLLVLSLLSGGGFGGGDIKYFAVCGLFLGPLGAALAFGAACVCASAFWLPGLISGRIKSRDKLPFGAFLAFGTLLVRLLSPLLPALF